MVLSWHEVAEPDKQMYSLASGSDDVVTAFHALLQHHGFLHDSAADVELIIDAPRGFALAYMGVYK